MPGKKKPEEEQAQIEREADPSDDDTRADGNNSLKGFNAALRLPAIEIPKLPDQKSRLTYEQWRDTVVETVQTDIFSIVSEHKNGKDIHGTVVERLALGDPNHSFPEHNLVKSYLGNMHKTLRIRLGRLHPSTQAKTTTGQLVRAG